MSDDPQTLEIGPLTEALLLADAEDPQSMDDLRGILAGLIPWPRAEQAEAVEPVISECLAVLDGAGDGDAGEALARLSALLAPVMESAAAEETPPPARRAGGPRGADDHAAKGPGGPAEQTRAAPDTPAAAAPAPASLADDPELVREFVDRSREHLDEADALLLALEDDKDDAETVNSVFRVFHTVKGMAGFLAFQEIEEAAHDAEGKLDAVRKDAVALDRDMMDSLFSAVDILRGLLDQVLVPASQGEAPASGDASEPGSGDATAPAPEGMPGTPATATAPSAARDQAPRTKAVAAKVRGTVHVDEERLDRLLETIGELVIAEANVSQSLHALEDAPETIATQFGRLDKISRQLQEMATSMRMVTFRTTMRRMARLVRDLSREAGKNVKCVLEGEEIELDKHVVEGINDSLIHLVRNAVDHGIETDPDERVRAGKSPTATVRISALHTGGRIVIEVADDGRGIDMDAVVRRARDLEIIGPDETPAPEAVPQLIFSPGFSTARTVTEVSGRGVGMDVVKRTAEALLGSVAVSSSPGRGTTVRLTLPLTLAIIEGMTVRVGSERYIIPALSIVRSLRMDPQDATGVLGQAEMLATPQGLVPLVRLARLFAASGRGSEGGAEDGDDLVTVVSEADGSSLTGLVVSELLGQQQIVMKSLGAGLGDVPGVSGAAILPDGTVGLVIDVQQTVRLAHGRKG